jgi:HNH endonuclease
MFNELFNYDPATGILTWKVSRSNRVRPGQIAGSLQIGHKNKPYERRYLHVSVCKRMFLVHRIAYEMMTGAPVPPGMQIDHVDGDGTNNKWANLRPATRSQNMGNRGRNRFRKHDLPKGIGWHGPDRLYVARIAGRTVKYSKSLTAAKAAYDEAAADYFGEFARS